MAAHTRSSKGVLLQREWSRMLGPQTGRGHPSEGPSEEEEAARPAAGSEDRADGHACGALGTTQAVWPGSGQRTSQPQQGLCRAQGEVEPFWAKHPAPGTVPRPVRQWASSCGVTAEVKPTSSSEKGRRKECLADGPAAVGQGQGDDEQVFQKGQRLSDKEHREGEELVTPRSMNRPHPRPRPGVSTLLVPCVACGPSSWFGSDSLGRSLFGVSSVMQGWEEYPSHRGVVKRK